MCKKSIESATNKIRGEMNSGKLPNKAKRMLVNDLLENGSCICGTSLVTGTSTRKHVENAMARITNEVQYDIANDIRYHNDQFFEDYNRILDRIDSEMQSIQDMRTKLARATEEVHELEREMSEYDDNFGSWINERDQLKPERDNCLIELDNLKKEINEHIAGKGDELRRLIAIKTRRREEKESLMILEKDAIVKATMREIKNDVDATIRKLVSDETLRIFNNLTWKPNYTRLFIDDGYYIHITGKDGFEVTSVMSAGEKLLLALSFIMALKKITNYKFPFVIDSSLGKLSGDSRILFGQYIPELLDGSQLVMLATNTEYTEQKIPPDDGSKATHTLRELFQEKATVQEYKIDITSNNETTTDGITSQITMVEGR